MTFKIIVTKYFSRIAFLLAMILLIPASGLAQSTDPAHPTPISGFPLVGRLAAGTYYYQVPVGAGPVTMGLQFTPPTGGASMSVALSGPDCCTAEAYVGGDTGGSETIRIGSGPFTIPSAQTLLVTMNIAIGARDDTVRFTLSMVIGGGSGIIVTPPPSPTPTPRPALTPATPTPCTDLAITDFRVIDVTRNRKVIKGNLLNLSSTAFLAGNSRGQYVAVYDISPSDTEPPMVGFWRFAGVPARGSLNFTVDHELTTPGPRRYEVRIVYLPLVATNRSTTDDDCNDSNNSTRNGDYSRLAPTVTMARPCPDLGLANFRVVDVTRNRKVIKGVIGNVSTEVYKGYPGDQYVGVYDISVSDTEPPLVGRHEFTEVSAGGTIDFSVEHRLPAARRTRYEVRIVYSRYNAMNRIPSDDDCNRANNSTRLQLMDGGEVLILEKQPDR